jgi:hypothetical protein
MHSKERVTVLDRQPEAQATNYMVEVCLIPNGAKAVQFIEPKLTEKIKSTRNLASACSCFRVNTEQQSVVLKVTVWGTSSDLSEFIKNTIYELVFEMADSVEYNAE